MRVMRFVCLGLAVGLFGPGQTHAQMSGDVVVKSFSAGQGPNSVGLVDASEDTEADVPQAIYSDARGDVYLLDQVNRRILKFDPKGRDPQTRSFELPSQIQPTDLVVVNTQIMVWDGDIHVLRPQGPEDAQTRGLDETPTRGIDDEFAVSAFAQMGSQKPQDDAELLGEGTRAIRRPSRGTRTRQAITHQAIASRGQGPIIVDVISERPAVARMEIRKKGETALFSQLRLEVRDRLGAAEFLEIDDQGRMYVLIENIPTASKNAASTYVARFSAQGRLESIYDIPVMQSLGLSRRFVTISPEGDVYFLRNKKGEVDVLGVGSREVHKRQTIIDGTSISQPQLSEFTPGKGFTAAVRPLTRQQVVQTAFAFEGVPWKVTPSAYGVDPDTACTGFRRIRRPGYLIGKLNQEVRGVPYCWGCHGSLAQISAKVSRGVLAGNVCTHNAPRTDVTGVDCSAFVSAAWGLAQHFTTIAIPSITDPVRNAWDMQPGDAINKPGSHVMLFLRFTPDRKVEVMESSPGACNGRVCRNVYPLAAILARGYKPVRFRALANDAIKIAAADQTIGAPANKKAGKRRHRR